MSCQKKNCAENQNSRCALGLHPSWPTCVLNKDKGVTNSTVQGTSYQAHQTAYQNTIQITGCFDIPGTESSRR